MDAATPSGENENGPDTASHPFIACKPNSTMAERYLITADRAHLRIYRYSQEPGQYTPSIQPVDALDLQEARHSYLDGADLPGRFPTPAARGLAAEERAPLEMERDQELIEQLAERIAVFMQHNPNSTWDLAAPSTLHNQLVDSLPDAVRRRLNQIIPRDLVNVPPAELREQFALR